jgi:hypothetical protein
MESRCRFCGAAMERRHGGKWRATRP